MTRKVKRRQTVELSVEKVAFGGMGMAYLDEYVVFVENTLPGDRVQARVKKAKSNYAEAYPIEILEPSPLRQDAPCRHFGHCGGCKWQNVDYQKQLDFKTAHVGESLRHIGGVDAGVLHRALPSDPIFGYRNKMEFSFSHNRWLTPEELRNPEIKKGFALGMHVPRHFDRILDIEKCWLQSERMNRVLAFSKGYFTAAPLSVYNLHSKEGILRFLVIRESVAYQNLMVNVVSSESITDELQEYITLLTEAVPEVVSIINTVNDSLAQVATGRDQVLLYGAPVIYEKLGRHEFEISPNSFFQTNSRQAKTLYDVVRAYAGLCGERVWDLYCGTGSIAIYLADLASEVVGFEIVEDAVRDADRNAALNGVHNCSFVAGDLRFNLEKYAGNPPEVLICDPPRAGMHKDVVAAIRQLGPRRIVYVSCNPATMARDLAELVQDYQVAEVQPVDMFPHTYHIESVARLERREEADPGRN